MKTEKPCAQSPRHQSQTLKFSAEKGVSGARGLQSYRLRPGLMLAITSPMSETPFKATFDIDDAPIQFGFTYSGQNRCNYAGGALRNQTHEMQTGSNGIFYLPKTHGIIEQPHDNPACVLGIIASPSLLRSYFADSMNDLPAAFRQTLDGTREKPMTWFGKCNPVKHCLLTQIINCPYTGGMRRLFMESRVMELLVIQLNEHIKSETRSPAACRPLTPADVERIRHARDILVSDLENPPTLQDLAARAGINERKLKTGFRQVFNTSVFRYFREHRMHKAHELLQQGNLNVTEVAYTVGYQSLSHFSHAFKKRFGILPKKFLANQLHLLAS